MQAVLVRCRRHGRGSFVVLYFRRVCIVHYFVLYLGTKTSPGDEYRDKSANNKELSIK